MIGNFIMIPLYSRDLSMDRFFVIFPAGIMLIILLFFLVKHYLIVEDNNEKQITNNKKNVQQLKKNNNDNILLKKLLRLLYQNIHFFIVTISVLMIAIGTIIIYHNYSTTQKDLTNNKVPSQDDIIWLGYPQEFEDSPSPNNYIYKKDLYQTMLNDYSLKYMGDNTYYDTVVDKTYEDCHINFKNINGNDKIDDKRYVVVDSISCKDYKRSFAYKA